MSLLKHRRQPCLHHHHRLSMVRRGWRVVDRPVSLFLLMLLVVQLLVQPSMGQRFLRQGFSNAEDFGAEMKIDDGGDGTASVDMTREMFIMQDYTWQLQPPSMVDDVHVLLSSKSNNNNNNAPKMVDGVLRRHIHKYIKNQPIEMKLLKKRGKFGLRAVASTTTTEGTKITTAGGQKQKRLRAFWRPAPALPRGSVDYLKSSYDDACRSRLFTVEFELQLPPLSRNNNKGDGKATSPSLVYQFSVEPGSVNPKALVPRSHARVYVYPQGRSKTTTSQPPLFAGSAPVSITPIKSGLVDPNWAKGRPIFRQGRNSGFM